MKLARRKFLHLAAGAVALPAVSLMAGAQTYPTRPMNVVQRWLGNGNDLNKRPSLLLLTRYHCRCARSVPICIETDADLPDLASCATTLLCAFDWRRPPVTSGHTFLFIELAKRWGTLDGHAACEGHLSGEALFRSLSPQL